MDIVLSTAVASGAESSTNSTRTIGLTESNSPASEVLGAACSSVVSSPRPVGQVEQGEGSLTGQQLQPERDEEAEGNEVTEGDGGEDEEADEDGEGGGSSGDHGEIRVGEEYPINLGVVCSCGTEVGKAWNKIFTCGSMPLFMQERLLAEARTVGLQEICLAHLHALGRSVGLKVPDTRKELIQRLDFLDRNWHKGFRQPGWFKAHLPTIDTTSRFLAQPRQFHMDVSGLLARLNIFWGMDITAVLTGSFEEKGWGYLPANVQMSAGLQLQQNFREELDMYRHHQGIGGYLMNCYYSLAQQFYSQHPLVYMTAVLLSRNNNHRLLVSPSLALHLQPDDKAPRRTMDLKNLKSYVWNGKGGNSLQVSIPLDPEDAHNCFEVIEGFQKVLPDWWKKVEARGGKTSEKRSLKMMGKLYDAQDKKDFGVFVPVPMKAATIFIRRPEIPFGSVSGRRGVCTADRRVINLQYMSLNLDGEPIDDSDEGTTAGIGQGYSSLSFYTQNRLREKSKMVRFPASVHYEAPWAIGRALRGVQTWDDPEVVDVLNRVFNGPLAESEAYIKGLIEESSMKVKACYLALEKYEEEIYGRNSFYRSSSGMGPRQSESGSGESQNGGVEENFTGGESGGNVPTLSAEGDPNIRLEVNEETIEGAGLEVVSYWFTDFGPS